MPSGELKIATWNLEFLAERDGSGGRPRQAADYADMHGIAGSLNADVIAFQEAENLTAAVRVFDPERNVVVKENRLGNPGGNCSGAQASLAFIRQAVGFAIRKRLAFDRTPDLTALQLGNPNLRSGVDITIKPAGGRPIRLLALHLKSGCASGSTAELCPTLAQQVPVVERWVDAAAVGPIRFGVLGDWNRRLAQVGDTIWADLDDGVPANANLTLTDHDIPPRCDERYRNFIDHIVLDNRATGDFKTFTETTYATEVHASDHCPVSVVLAK